MKNKVILAIALSFVTLLSGCSLIHYNKDENRYAKMFWNFYKESKSSKADYEELVKKYTNIEELENTGNFACSKDCYEVICSVIAGKFDNYGNICNKCNKIDRINVTQGDGDFTTEIKCKCGEQTIEIPSETIGLSQETKRFELFTVPFQIVFPRDTIILEINGKRYAKSEFETIDWESDEGISYMAYTITCDVLDKDEYGVMPTYKIVKQSGSIINETIGAGSSSFSADDTMYKYYVELDKCIVKHE